MEAELLREIAALRTQIAVLSGGAAAKALENYVERRVSGESIRISFKAGFLAGTRWQKEVDAAICDKKADSGASTMHSDLVRAATAAMLAGEIRAFYANGDEEGKRAE